MEALPTVVSAGWASGINGYAVVLILGLAGRFLGAGQVPVVLQRDDVLIAAAILTLLDLVADKIPYVDSVWDAVHTVIRPSLGAIVGALLAGQAGTLDQAVAAGFGGTTALVSHLIKAGLRIAVNTSPEPASNIVLSSTEDVTVAGVTALALLHPWIALAVVGVLLVVGLTVIALVWSRIRLWLRRRRERRAGTPVTPPEWRP